MPVAAEPGSPSGHPFRSLLLEAVGVLALCAIFAAMVVAFARNTSATFDETTHLPAGYSYLKWHDYRMNPEHPPLVKKLAACGLWGQPVWPGEIQELPEGEPIRHAWELGVNKIDTQWVFGHELLYGARDLRVIPPLERLTPADFHNDADDLMFRGRMMILLLGLALAVLVYFWSRELFGVAGGVLSLALFCFDPNFIAHSGLVTTDVGISLFYLGTVYFLWRFLRRPTSPALILFALFFGLAFTVKFSAVLLVPILVLLLAAWMFAKPTAPPVAAPPPAAHWRRRLGVAVGVFGMAGLSAWVCIWAAYSFRYSAAARPEQAAREEAQATGTGAPAAPYRTPGHFDIEETVRLSALAQAPAPEVPAGLVGDARFRWAMDHVPLGLTGKLILLAQRHQLLPEAFLYGFAYAQQSAQVRTAFLLGESSPRGFFAYFFYTVLFKTPVPALLAIICGLVLILIHRLNRGRDVAFLLLPVAFYALVAVVMRLNIGQRHLLPVYPFLYVLAGATVLGWRRARSGFRCILAVMALLLIGLSSQFVLAPQRDASGKIVSGWQRVAPHYLAYFNEIAGGPANGYRSLVDSNLDWGQDLKNLRSWLVQHHYEKPIWLGYFGRADPRYYQILHHNLPGGVWDEPEEKNPQPERGDLIAVSATKLQGVYLTREQREIWARLLERSTLLDTVGYSIFVFEYEGDPPATK